MLLGAQWPIRTGTGRLVHGGLSLPRRHGYGSQPLRAMASQQSRGLRYHISVSPPRRIFLSQHTQDASVERGKTGLQPRLLPLITAAWQPNPPPLRACVPCTRARPRSLYIYLGNSGSAGGTKGTSHGHGHGSPTATQSQKPSRPLPTRFAVGPKGPP